MKRCLAAALALLLLLVGALPASAQVVLVDNFGRDAEMLSYGEGEDGSYSQALLIDAVVLITTGCEVPEEGRNDTLDAVIASVYPDAYDILVLDMPPVAGYPAEHIRFYQGDSESTSIVDYVRISTEDKVFFMEISMPEECREDYEELVDVWVDSVDLFDDGLDGEGDDAPGGEEETASYPLEWNDLSTYVILTDEDDTVLDLVEMFNPSWFTWLTDEETGDMRLTFVCEGGLLVVEPESAESLRVDQGEEGAPDLPDAVLEGCCDFVEAQWQSAGFVLYPLRGLYVGDEMTAVVEAYAGGESVDIADAGLGYDELISYTVGAEAPENGEAVLTYYGLEGSVACIQLSWFDASGE